MLNKNIIKNNKHLLIIIFTLILITSLSVFLIFGNLYAYSYGVRPEINDSSENVILLIGDGMGFNHIEVAKFFDTPVMTQMEYHSAVSTHSLSFSPTDSAASATAMATGFKVKNRAISYSKGKNLVNLGELVLENNKKLGIVTTKSVTDATPAAFTSHNKHRNNHQNIALEQIRRADCDVLFGLGREYFDNYSNEINTSERAYVTNYQDLLASTKEKVYGIFDEPIPNEGDFTLSTLTTIALDMLKNDNGFLLMVEGAKIDSYSHGRDMEGMLKEFWAFNEAIKVALAFASINPNTTVIVTADHETGNLTLPKTLTQNNINDKLFKSSNHTGKDVPFFVVGPGASQVPAKIDNTDIYYIIKQLLFND